MMQQISKLFFIAMIILFLSACGGGGGGSSSDNDTGNNGAQNNNTSSSPASLASININTPQALATIENNSVSAFTIALGSQPTADVMIALSSSDTTEGTISPENIIFTPENWSQSQTIFVSGVDDNEADGNIAFNIISAAAVSDDEEYNGLDPVDVSIINNDDETASAAAILISDITGLTTVEGADSATFSIQLASQPTASTTIELLTTDASEGFVSPAAVTFTPANWNNPQLVNVIGQDDLSADGSTRYAIITKPAVSLDPQYNNLNASDIIITNIDNDTRPVIDTFSLDQDFIANAGSSILTWSSNAQTCKASGATANGQWQDDDLPSSGSRQISNLTNPGNYSFTLTCSTNNIDSISQTVNLQVAPQQNEPSVTLSASRDTNINYNGSTKLTWMAPDATNCVASDGWSGNKANQNLSGEVIQGLTQDTTFTLRCSNSEGTSNTSLRVKVNPANPVIEFFTASPNKIDQGRSTTLAWQSKDITECTAIANPSNSDWPAKINVTNGLGLLISHLQETTTFTINCIGVDESRLSRSTTVSVNTAAIQVSPTQGLSTSELGASASFTVQLSTKPTAPVSINLRSSDPTEGSIDTDVITFDTENWNTSKNITITGQDDLVVDGTTPYQIILDPAVSTDSVYKGMNAADITVTNTDNDVYAVINRFNTSATSIVFGAAVTLTWASDGDSCSASGSTAGGQWQGDNLPSSGSQTLMNLTEAGANSFMLTCVKGGINSEVSSLTVNVAPQIDAPTVTLTANPVANIPYNSATTLTWSSTDTNSCVASGGWTGNRATENSQGIIIANLTDSTTFTLDCTGPGGTGSSTVSVTVAPANPSIDFLSATTANITEGDPTTLSWQTTDISQCTATASPTINGWSGTLAPNNINGQVINNIQTTTTFSLNCVGIDGTNLSKSIIINTQPPSPTINLAANPSTINFNGATTLSWSSTHADSCIASGGWSGQRNTENTQGEVISNIVANTAYTLTCTGAGGSVSATENINVIPANARITSFNAIPANIERGASTILTWQSSDIASCNANATPANSDWSGTVPVNSISGVNINNLQQSTTFTLNCTGIDNSSVNQSLQINVNNSMNLAGNAERGRQLYLNPLPGTSFSCADCHGADGIATFIAPRDINIAPCHEGRCENEETLATYTSNAMPIGTSINNRICDQQCGRDIAAYLFSEVIDQQGNNQNSLPMANSAFFDGVSPLPDETVIRKAAILVAGRLPTDAELATAGNRDQMKQALINMMQGPGFDAFIEETVNDRLLSKGLDRVEAYNTNDFPRLTTYPSGDAGRDRIRMLVNGLRSESHELVKYIINNDKPYTEILTADYTMVNPETAYLYDSLLIEPFPDDADTNTFVPAKTRLDLNGRLTGPFPHAGLLTQPSYVAKWISTDTNRARSRARVTADIFLGIDLEALAVRSIDTNSSENHLNPTLTNPNCTVCHNTVDPIAGTFQNWGNNRSTFRPRNYASYKHVISADYVNNARDENNQRYYQPGDLWYRTMSPPGYPFTGAIMPQERNDSALQWLGEQIVADSQFDTGTIKFWYTGLFGRRPIISPLDSNNAQQIAFEAQNALFEEIGRNFRRSGHNFKQMLAELILSPWFRAGSIDHTNTNRPEFNQLGMARLLTPEQLNRKLVAVFGMSWEKLINDDDYYLTYGGFNSDEFDKRNDQLSSVMSSMIDFAANELSCELVRDDFSRAASQRILFPYVSRADTSETNELAMRNNLVHLHNHILGQKHGINDIEIDNALALFAQVNAASQTDNIASPCNVGNDDNFALRSWMAMLTYFIGSYEFLYE